MTPELDLGRESKTANPNREKGVLHLPKANQLREIEDFEFTKQVKVTYGKLCPICNSRIDSTGLCGCGAGGA